MVLGGGIGEKDWVVDGRCLSNRRKINQVKQKSEIVIDQESVLQI